LARLKRTKHTGPQKGDHERAGFKAIRHRKFMKKVLLKTYWETAYWILLFGWVLGAGLAMGRVDGGFFTNYLTDLTFPAWYYIVLRSLGPAHLKSLSVLQWFARSPERAALSIFIVGVLTETKTFYWPQPPIGGTFDPLDIFAYGIGLSICFYFDKRYT